MVAFFGYQSEVFLSFFSQIFNPHRFSYDLPARNSVRNNGYVFGYQSEVFFVFFWSENFFKIRITAIDF
ncbi:hypothetical protein AW14_06880 [Siansivirga zeaxanthinifaciens CC-SAMT-1]|uniref:Uncharacterized protein n=1 Tax=Siansivirga zeaxanthinifaciens CC-SAMT-1 TaxID=1454006 RepID=A0A0C5WI53_9FLAO|nr:hypothetical protein AW14_06880 [Siansivirga zeaxanthinifaciens CC-SAMT-1]